MKTNFSAIALRWKTPGVAIVVALAVVLSLLAAPLAHAQGDVLPLKTSNVAAADITLPSDVENVKAVEGNSEVTLTWNVATDDSGVKGYNVYYGTKPVVKDGDKYAFGPVDIGNKITYTLSGLTTGVPYYFAVTAYDAAGNESGNYSSEVTATPLLGSADSEAPKVTKAEAVSKTQVRIVFSEVVSIPGINPQGAFSIMKDPNGPILGVTGASMDVSDPANKTVLLTTAQQEADTDYIVIVGTQVKDASGNYVKSGTSDTALFVGSSKEPVLVTQETVQTMAQADTVPPELVAVSAPDSTHVVITFSEPLKAGADSPLNYVITEEKTIDNVIDVSAATLSADKKTVTLTTAPQKAMNYNLIVLDVTDAARNMISTDTNAAVFTGGGEAPSTQETQTQETMETQATQPVQDMVAPEDATQFMATVLDKVIAHLSWVGSVNTAGDLANYVLYQSTDGKTYSDGLLLDAAAKVFDASSLSPDMKYFFKLTAKDAAGNESKGVVATLILPETGPELGFLLLGSLGLGKILTRKKKK